MGRFHRLPTESRIERLPIEGEQEQFTYPELNGLIGSTICECRTNPAAPIRRRDENRRQPSGQVTVRFDVALDKAGHAYDGVLMDRYESGWNRPPPRPLFKASNSISHAKRRRYRKPLSVMEFRELWNGVTMILQIVDVKVHFVVAA
jgi:hypothetical protein